MVSTVKAYDVGKGSMYYINDNASEIITIIDCYLVDDKKDRILRALKNARKGKIVNFISTHSHSDHIRGLKELHRVIQIDNFCYVEQGEVLNGDEDSVFYKEIIRGRTNINVFKMNSNDLPISEGISVIWPHGLNEDFSNDRCPIFTYTACNNIVFAWFGDTETNTVSKRATLLKNTHVDVLFAPHHGRKSGMLPQPLFDSLGVRVKVLGNCSEKDEDDSNPEINIKQRIIGDLTILNNDDDSDFYIEKATSNIPKTLEIIDSKKTDRKYIGTLKRESEKLGDDFLDTIVNEILLRRK